MPVAPGGGEPGAPVRFLAIGDAGEGNADQRLVGEAAAAVCAERGCDLVLYLGDNLYQDKDDIAALDFAGRFEEPYRGLDLPFYVVLGNHDYGRWTVSRARAEAELAYAERSEKWVMPDFFYSFTYGDVTFVGLDTNALYSGWVLDWDDPQLDWLGQVMEADTPWTVAFGHHPWRSNGKHGSAGGYEGIPLLGWWLESVFEEQLCGRADLYLSGHDHNRQWLAPECGVELVVSGAGAKVTPLVGRDVESLWAEDQSPGFAWFSIEGEVMTGAFYDKTGVMGFERSVNRSD